MIFHAADFYSLLSIISGFWWNEEPELMTVDEDSLAASFMFRNGKALVLWTVEQGGSLKMMSKIVDAA